MQTKVPNYIGLYRTKTGIYVIRIAAPKDLKEKRKQVKREIKHSLRTRDWEKAKEAYHEFMRNLSSEMARCAIIPSNEPYPQDKFNEDVLEKAYDYYQQYSENVIPAFLQQINSPNDDEETRRRNNKRVKDYIQENIENLSAELNSNKYSDNTRKMLNNFLCGRYSLSPEQKEKAMQTFVKAKLEGLLNYKTINITFDSTKENYRYHYSIIEEAVRSYGRKSDSSLRRTIKKPEKVTLKDIFLRWSQEAVNISERIPKVKSFIKIFPEKDDLSQIKSSDICEWIEVLRQLPAGYAREKQFEGKSIQEIINIADKNKLPRMKKLTINGYLTAFSGFYVWAKKKNLVGNNDVNPTKDLFYSKKETNAEAKKPKAFTPENAKALIEYYKKYYKIQRPDFFWASMIMLHCGLRQKEASQLLISDIHTRNGLSYISVQADNSDIKSVKNEHSRRSIPIHQQLIDWGFLEYVEEQQKKTTSDNNRLFPNITMHNKGDRYSASKYYNKYFGEVLKGINLEGKGYSSYSMRHTFMDYLRRAGYSDKDISFVVGHNSQETMTSHYGDFHETPTQFLEKAKVMIDKVQY
jgi:putative integrase/resolvase recombinase protein phage-related integrase